jgi:hypothetical protein
MNAPLSEADQKARALDYILAAWDSALQAGVEPEFLASAAIFAALTDMVDLHGADAVAQLCETLPERVRKGEFTLSASGAGGEG